MRKLAGLLRLMRPPNGFMMGFAVIVGASLSIQQPMPELIPKILLGFITAFSLTSASMAINDYYDREIDRINEPSRPIPSGTIKAEESLIFAAILSTLGLAAAYITSHECLLIAAASLIVSITYATKGKRTGLPGNFLVSACVAIPFIYGGYVSSSGLSLKALIFTAMAFLSNTGREIVKGIVDVAGDEAEGIRTFAVSHGPRAAAYLGSAFYMSAVILSPLPLILNPPLVTLWFIPPVIAADIGFIASSLKLLKNPTRENAKKIKNATLAWMALGLIAFYIGNI